MSQAHVGTWVLCLATVPRVPKVACVSAMLGIRTIVDLPRLSVSLSNMFLSLANLCMPRLEIPGTALQ